MLVTIEVGTDSRAAWGSVVMRGTVAGRGLSTAARQQSVHQTACQSSGGRACSDGMGWHQSVGAEESLSVAELAVEGTIGKMGAAEVQTKVVVGMRGTP